MGTARGRVVLSGLLVLMIGATAVADLGFMHASNQAWPPHARMHAVWNVAHVAATHGLALAVLWIGPGSQDILRMRIATGIFLAFTISFFVASGLAPMFGASVHPDLPAEQMPPTLFGLDGNSLGFLLAMPIALLVWIDAERGVRRS